METMAVSKCELVARPLPARRAIPSVALRPPTAETRRIARDGVAATRERQADDKVLKRRRAATQQPQRLRHFLMPRTPQVTLWGHLPVMFTAPHGIQLLRGNPHRDEPVRHHGRERLTTEIALKLSLLVGRHVALTARKFLSESTANVPPPHLLHCSATVWNCAVAKPFDPQNLDPNYLFVDQFAVSPWHQSLVELQQRLQQDPEWTDIGGVVPLHVDLHGKLPRDDNFDVDVGIESMKVLHSDTAFSRYFEQVLETHLTAALRLCNVTHPKLETGPTLNMDPWLNGLWGTSASDPHTMTTQAVQLGIPSVQLELPPLVRQALNDDDGFLDAFAAALANVFWDIQNLANRESIAQVLCARVAMHPDPHLRETACALIDDCSRLRYEWRHAF